MASTCMSARAGSVVRGAKSAVPQGRAFAPTARPVSVARHTTRAAAVDEPEVAVDTASLYATFDQLLDQYDASFAVGDKVTGTVYNIDQKNAYVDIGSKAPAILPSAEISLVKVDKIAEAVPLGTRREFEIVGQDREGSLILSLKKAETAFAWQRIRQLQEEEVVLTGLVTNANRGGIMVEVENLRGFVPGSHLASATNNYEDLFGEEMPLKILEADEESGRLVLSNRRAQGSDSMVNFKVGDVITGTVTAVMYYGAFLNIGGGVTGLLHISQISHDRVVSVERVLSVGDSLKCMILSHDKEKGRVALSTKKLEPTPGDMLRDPAIVFEKAEEMAAMFRERVAAAEAAAKAEEARLQEASEGAAEE